MLHYEEDGAKQAELLKALRASESLATRVNTAIRRSQSADLLRQLVIYDQEAVLSRLGCHELQGGGQRDLHFYGPIGIRSSGKDGGKRGKKTASLLGLLFDDFLLLLEAMPEAKTTMSYAVWMNPILIADMSIENAEKEVNVTVKSTGQTFIVTGKNAQAWSASLQKATQPRPKEVNQESIIGSVEVEFVAWSKATTASAILLLSVGAEERIALVAPGTRTVLTLPSIDWPPMTVEAKEALAEDITAAQQVSLAFVEYYAERQVVPITVDFGRFGYATLGIAFKSFNK